MPNYATMLRKSVVQRATYAPARSFSAPLDSPKGVDREVGFFAAPDGTTLFTQSWLPQRARRGHVVLVHGLCEHSSRYVLIANTLAERQFAVHAYDLRGHAHSEGVRGDFVIDQHRADLLAFTRRVVKREDPSLPFILLGQGAGSILSLLFAAEASGRLAAVVSLAPAMKLARPDSWGAMLATALHPDACVVECEWKHRSRDPRVVERYWTDPLIWTAGLTRRAAKELAAGWHLLRAHASSLRVPLLLLQGGADMLSDPREAHAFYDAAGSAVKMMHIYTGLAHDLLHEPEQESILGDIVSWLEAHM